MEAFASCHFGTDEDRKTDKKKAQKSPSGPLSCPRLGQDQFLAMISFPEIFMVTPSLPVVRRTRKRGRRSAK